MENKNNSIFDKLDSQNDKLDDLSSKLENVSIKNLYALAKRTWDYGDFETAQKYYNHISLLNPIDWEAPLYASLCNIGNITSDNILLIPEKLEKIVIATINYINGLDIEKKEIEISKCIAILKEELKIYKNIYFANKDKLEKLNYHYKYVISLENCFFNIYKTIKNINNQYFEELINILADYCLELIESSNKLPSNYTDKEFNELLTYTTKKCNINEIINFSIKSFKTINNLSLEEKNNIKLKGTMYFEYNDKTISKHYFSLHLLIGIVLLLFSIFGIILPSSTKHFSNIFFLSFIIYGIMLILKAITQKNKIKSSSILNFIRVKNRLTSNNSVTIDEKSGFMRIFSTIIFLSFMPGMLFTASENFYKLILYIMNLLLVHAINTFNHETYNYPITVIYYYNGEYYFED